MSVVRDLAGEASTFATMLIWDDAEFEYARVIDCARHRDARAEFLALHNPPMVIVLSVRWDREVVRP
jgi:hypothetical protein